MKNFISFTLIFTSLISTSIAQRHIGAAPGPKPVDPEEPEQPKRKKVLPKKKGPKDIYDPQNKHEIIKMNMELLTKLTPEAYCGVLTQKVAELDEKMRRDWSDCEKTENFLVFVQGTNNSHWTHMLSEFKSQTPDQCVKNEKHVCKITNEISYGPVLDLIIEMKADALRKDCFIKDGKQLFQELEKHKILITPLFPKNE